VVAFSLREEAQHFAVTGVLTETWALRLPCAKHIHLLFLSPFSFLGQKLSPCKKL
jgi:hypothetical protein